MDTRRIHTEDSKESSKKIIYAKIHESIGARHYEKYVTNKKLTKIKLFHKNFTLHFI